MRFYAWVNNGYLSVPTTYKVNGVTTQYLNFSQARNCVSVTVTVDLSSVPTNNRSDFLFYLEADCQYSNCSSYQVSVDNIAISQPAQTQTSSIFTGLPAGNYPITVTDTYGCVVTLPNPVQVTEPAVMLVSAN
jgi:hypothetical protein